MYTRREKEGGGGGKRRNDQGMKLKEKETDEMFVSITVGPEIEMSSF
jgi:hypothetical protein